MTVKAGTSVVLDASAHFSEPESETISYSLISVPDASGWLSIDQNTGQINSPVTNSEAGLYSVTIYGRDPHFSSTSEQGSANFALTV